uniref:Uncharacterized protein n=1 Tax=Arundo donax TaxID=35708 RepID=A0A0A9BUL2_ARUDO
MPEAYPFSSTLTAFKGCRYGVKVLPL